MRVYLFLFSGADLVTRTGEILYKYTQEPITRSLQLSSQCNGIFTDQSIFRNYSRKISQFQST